MLSIVLYKCENGGVQMDNNMNTTDNMNSVNVTSPAPVGNGKMREKYTRIWAWMGIPGLIVALTAGNREEELTKKIRAHSPFKEVWRELIEPNFIVKQNKK